MTKNKLLIKNLQLTATLVLTMYVTACGIEDESTEPPMVRTTEEKVIQTIYSEVQYTDFLNLKGGQYVHYEGNYRAELGSVIKFRDRMRLVQKVEQADNVINVSMIEDKFSYDQLGNITDQNHFDVEWPIELDNGKIFGLNILQFNRDDEKIDDVEVQYFNLESKRISQPAPALAAARPNCSNIPNCRLRGLQVSYVAVVKKSGKTIDRFRHTLTVSRDVPPIFIYDNDGNNENDSLLPLINECTASLYEDAIYVSVCNVLRDMYLAAD